MSKYDQLETSSLDAGNAHDLPATSPVKTPCSSAEAGGVSVITPTSLALGDGASVNSSSSSTNALNQQSFLPSPTTPTSGADFLGFSTDSFRSLLAELCEASGASHVEQMCNTLCATLKAAKHRDSVAVLRGREFTVKRSSGALESDWQLVFGAQVEQDEDGDDVVLCYQASSRTHRPCAVRSLQKYNAALFQEPKSGASAVDSAAPMPPLYRAELLYMLACHEPDAERKGDADADFREVCARTAHAELCRLRGDDHADTLSCLATLAMILGKQEKIVEARECFVKCCEGRAATLGRDHEDTLGINEAFAGFLKEQQEHDAARSLLLDCLQRKDSVAALRGREFTVERSSGALESDWQLTFGAQVEQDEDGDDVVLCYQASSRTHRPCAVDSLRKLNAALFQETKSSAPAVDAAAAMPPLYRAELLYMLACQEADTAHKGDADFTEGCARTAHLELCRLRGDDHADTLSCLATLAVLLGKQGKIVEARECFVKCCERRAGTLGRDHEDTLRIQEAFAGFLKEQPPAINFATECRG